MGFLHENEIMDSGELYIKKLLVNCSSENTIFELVRGFN